MPCLQQRERRTNKHTHLCFGFLVLFSQALVMPDCWGETWSPVSHLTQYWPSHTFSSNTQASYAWQVSGNEFFILCASGDGWWGNSEFSFGSASFCLWERPINARVIGLHRNTDRMTVCLILNFLHLTPVQSFHGNTDYTLPVKPERLNRSLS